MDTRLNSDDELYREGSGKDLAALLTVNCRLYSVEGLLQSQTLPLSNTVCTKAVRWVHSKRLIEAKKFHLKVLSKSSPSYRRPERYPEISLVLDSAWTSFEKLTNRILASLVTTQWLVMPRTEEIGKWRKWRKWRSKKICPDEERMECCFWVRLVWRPNLYRIM